MILYGSWLSLSPSYDPYDSLMVPCGPHSLWSLWFPMIPYGSSWFPYGSLWFLQLVLQSSNWLKWRRVKSHTGQVVQGTAVRKATRTGTPGAIRKASKTREPKKAWGKARIKTMIMKTSEGNSQKEGHGDQTSLKLPWGFTPSWQQLGLRAILL